jgi:uncharacterized membrane protein YdjX (TVP38/TMEM64 family)
MKAEDGSNGGCRSGWQKWAAGLILLILGVLVVWAYLQASPSFAPFGLSFSDPARLRATIGDWGPWGAVALIVLQIAQVLLAPIPGQVLGFVAGYLYGPWLGTLLNMTGTLIGAGIAIGVARRFGRPLVQRFVSRAWLDRLDRLARRRGPAVFFLIFLFPFLPDDAACFAAGLSPLPMRELMLLVLVGRLPGVFIPNWLGAHATALSPAQWLVIILLMIPLAAAFWHWQDWIEEKVMQLFQRLTDQG